MPARQGRNVGEPADWKNSALGDDILGSNRKALKAETLGNASATVITIRDIDRITVPDSSSETGNRTSLVLASNEYPDLGFWLNKSGTRTLVEAFGEKPNKWLGERIPLVVVRVNNPQTQQPQKSLQVAPLGEWDEVFNAFDGRSRRAAAASNGPAKRATKTAKRRAK